MDLSGICRHIARLPAALAAAAFVAGVASADPAGTAGKHAFSAMFPDGCRSTSHDGAKQSPADIVRTFATELGLSGQQQQDLQILTADYGERLRDLANLMRESGEQLLKTEPGDPNYWPLAQEVSATAAASSAETVILLSEMREKLSMVLTAEQRDELKRRIEARKAACMPPVDTEQSP